MNWLSGGFDLWSKAAATLPGPDCLAWANSPGTVTPGREGDFGRIPSAMDSLVPEPEQIALRLGRAGGWGVKVRR